MKAEIENFEERIREQGMSLLSRKIPKSLAQMKIGQVYFFDYDSQPTGVIIITTKKTNRGHYLSNKGNRLLTCLKLNGDAESFVLGLVLKNLQGRQNSAKYSKTQRGPSGITKAMGRFFSGFKERVRNQVALSLFGKNNFRTYNWAKIENITAIQINK